MDRKEKPDAGSDFANSRSISEGDALILGSGLGREDDQGADLASEASGDVHKPIDAVPRSAVTGRHDPGTGANETVDGLSDSEEALRRAAEDTPPGSEDADEPVFDRAQGPPKV